MKQYWKPQPKLYGLDFWALLLPAVCYAIGVILFGGEAIQAGAITGETQGCGSWLMVIGGEIGTLSSVFEVFRKHKDARASWLDWSGIGISLAATLGILLVVFTKLTPLTVEWIEPIKNWGPLILLLCSGVDFYANVMEFAFYRAHFDEQWTAWNDAKHIWEQAAQTRAQNEQPKKQKMPKLIGLRPQERRAALIDIHTANPNATSKQIAQKFGVAPSTIRRDLGILKEAGELGNNGNKVAQLEIQK